MIAKVDNVRGKCHSIMVRL